MFVVTYVYVCVCVDSHVDVFVDSPCLSVCLFIFDDSPMFVCLFIHVLYVFVCLLILMCVFVFVYSCVLCVCVFVC